METMKRGVNKSKEGMNMPYGSLLSLNQIEEYNFYFFLFKMSMKGHSLHRWRNL